MNKHDRWKYWAPAMFNLYGNNPVHDCTLERALGNRMYSDYCHRAHVDDFPMTDEMRELLQGLASPYGHVILKAYRIKKGLE